MPKLSALLARHFTVFTYDRRGRGDSGDTQPYAREREVEDIAALIEAAGGSAAVAGLSSGAALALEAAASGLNITKLAAYEPPYVSAASGRPEADHEAHLKRILAEGRRGDAVKYFMPGHGRRARVRRPAHAADARRLAAASGRRAHAADDWRRTRSSRRSSSGRDGRARQSRAPG